MDFSLTIEVIGLSLAVIGLIVSGTIVVYRQGSVARKATYQNSEILKQNAEIIEEMKVCRQEFSKSVTRLIEVENKNHAQVMQEIIRLVERSHK